MKQGKRVREDLDKQDDVPSYIEIDGGPSTLVDLEHRHHRESRDKSDPLPPLHPHPPLSSMQHIVSSPRPRTSHITAPAHHRRGTSQLDQSHYLNMALFSCDRTTEVAQNMISNFSAELDRLGGSNTTDPSPTHPHVEGKGAFLRCQECTRAQARCR